ncbi:uncharacterized protein BXZ73DRAFT_42375, partial [Epithele typhae]|uniref:uncharacterized protein n=1 Tax=Epithele typhae TaxID=378194 RepID=UPI00200871E1
LGTTSSDAATATTSASAPEILLQRSLSSSPTMSSPPHPSSSSSSLNAKLDSSASSSAPMDSIVDVEPDAQILEALKNKDRLYVLKLGEQMEALIKERRVRIDLSPTTTYQRMLVRRCSAYYKLSLEPDGNSKTMVVYCRAESRIPARRICELVPAVETSTLPAYQIIRRADRPLRGRQHSQPGSTAGEDADTSDVEASEAGSVGAVSSAASSGARRYKTIEEREAEYNEARSRIFMGFEEKKDKDKDMSANSSTFSLVSGSSTSGGRGSSSIGDMDDSASSAPTESEWSGPVTRDKRDSRRGPGSTTSSVRSLRSSANSYGANGSGSSRNSRATSPSFTYPTIYDPGPGQSYEQNQYGGQAQLPPGYIAHYVYPPYNAAPPPGQPYIGGYYYPQYPYQTHPHQHGDPNAAGVPDPMYPPPPNGHQQHQYAPQHWPTAPITGQPAHGIPQPPNHLPQQHHAQPNMHPPHPEQQAPHQMPPMQQGAPSYPPFPPYPANPAAYAYSVPGYYQSPYPPGAPMGPPPPPVPGQMYHAGPVPDAMSPNAGMGMDGHAISRTSSRNSNGHGSVSGKRGGTRTRGGWYGTVNNPGAFTYSPSNGMGGGNDAYGPRLSVRRTSGASSGSGSAGARTPADETSSTASSSTTSSSSRRTFTSTSTSSKHPLPARPDWAVGLKPQHSRHHDHHNASRTMSPARMGGGPAHLPPQPQPVLQPNDFPPLSSAPVPAVRQPAPSGAWTNASMSRVMNPVPNAAQGSALVHYPNSQQTSPQVPAAPVPAALGRLDEQDAFERPPPKNAELFNPKAAAAAARANGNGTGTGAKLVDKMGALALEGDGLAGEARVASPQSAIPIGGDVMGEAVAATS